MPVRQMVQLPFVNAPRRNNSSWTDGYQPMNVIFNVLIFLIIGLLACTGHSGSNREFTPLVFQQDSLPPRCTFTGELLGGARWSDANGENILLVSQNFKTGVDAGVQEIFGYNYVLDSGKCKLLWTWHDDNENICDMGEGLVSTIETDDVDGDGIAESAFIYTIEGACDQSPRLFTLVFHSASTVLTMKGTKPVHTNETTIAGGEIVSDSTFDSAPIEYSDFCTYVWQKTME